MIGCYHRRSASHSAKLMFENPREMEPLLPSDRDGLLGELALKTVQQSAALGGLLTTGTLTSVAGLLRQMNSYYSNLIEGRHTHPLDIDRAHKGDYANE